MSEGDQPRVKRSRFDTGPDANGAPPSAAAGPASKAGPPSSEAAKAALEKARAALATRQRLAETLAKLKKVPLLVAVLYLTPQKLSTTVPLPCTPAESLGQLRGAHNLHTFCS